MGVGLRLSGIGGCLDSMCRLCVLTSLELPSVTWERLIVPNAYVGVSVKGDDTYNLLTSAWHIVSAQQMVSII